MVVSIEYHNTGKVAFSINPERVFSVSFTRKPVEALKQIKEILPRYKEKYQTLLVCGMGGSSLGAKVIDSFSKAFKESEHQLVFLDNVTPVFVEKVLENLDWKNTAFCFVSKSGTTLETVVFLNLVLKELEKRNLSPSGRVIFVGDRGRAFEKLARELNCDFFEIPSDVDGRFSVLTPTGLVPAYFADFDIDELWEGALEVLKDRSEDNEAIKLAKFKMWHYLDGGRNISVMFAYGNYIFPFTFWYSQLWAESLGKNGKGQTPLKALGTVDQHSLVQLFREGPDDKVYQFVKSREFRWDMELPEETLILDYIGGKKVSDIFNALYEGTVEALVKTGRPVVTLELDRYSAFNLGYLFMLYMLATVAAAQILKVNPFGQPGVELGKKIAKEILQRKLTPEGL